MKLLRAKWILLGINALLAAALGLSWAMDPYQWLARLSRHEALAADAWQPIRLPQRRPFEEYNRQLLGLDLFRYGLQEEAKAPQKNVIDDYEFLGATQSPSGQRAFLRNTVTGETRTVSAQKDMLGDYLVAEIRQQGILLQKGDEQIELDRK